MKLVNWGNLDYPSINANSIEKYINYEVKFSIILILKDEINKNNFFKKIITKIQ